ncbi:P-loop containing nucleoside triphosphate hydrolase protein [Gymnopus androsaceus JB14]|uniref:DNA 3'-5' helicase n=1 Tax=Gymnopus androsaceus JB14 TaxID=1447944 RepID=A0A6A4GQC5_9AGAR|nr:P-loop containing nucleoside triphosphate hydrolase protein [Gymnopus androsaceus JB14]
MVSPLIALQDEQVNTFKDEFKLDAVAVNSSHGGCSPELMANVNGGKWQIVIISPEMLLSKRFIDGVLRNAEFRKRILKVAVDEAHVVSHWGDGFRKKYGELGMVRALLPPGVPMLAMSATLPARVPNVSLVVRAIENPLNSYRDLDFIIPSNICSNEQIPKTFLYADNVIKGVDIEDHLTELLPSEMQALGIIRVYSSAFSHEYRAEVMRLFRIGKVRVLICTDAAGMGCNLPDVDLVVQWKLPGTISSFVQRAGRAARAPNHRGLAVLLVEKSAYAEELGALQELLEDTAKKSGKKKKPGGAAAQKKTSAKDKRQYAEIHGVNRGSYRGKKDHVYLKSEPPIDETALNEGLFVLVQTGICRRQVLTKIFKNKEPELAEGVACCDLCDPTLLDKTRPGAPQTASRQSIIRKGLVHKETMSELHKWRTEIFKRDFSSMLFGPSGVLKDETVELLASVGPIKTLARLDKVLGGQWSWREKYGPSLVETLAVLEIPFIPKPKKEKSKAVKRAERPNKRSSHAALTPHSSAPQLTATASLTSTTTPRSVSPLPRRAQAPPVVPQSQSPQLSSNPYAALLSRNPNPRPTPTPKPRPKPRPLVHSAQSGSELSNLAPGQREGVWVTPGASSSTSAHWPPMQSPHDPSPSHTPSNPIPHRPLNAFPRGYMPHAMPSTHPSLIWTTQRQSHNQLNYHSQSSESSSSYTESPFYTESSPSYSPYHQFQSYPTPQQQPISQPDHSHSHPTSSLDPQAPSSPYIHPSNYPLEFTFQPPYQPSETPHNNTRYSGPSQLNSSHFAPDSTPYLPPPPPQ